MNDIDPQQIHDGERVPTLEIIGEQYGQLYDEDIPDITCICGRNISLEKMFRCLYCEIYFCKSCAKEHFGENR